MDDKPTTWDPDAIARIDIPSTRHMTDHEEHVASIKAMHDDLATLAEQDGCIAAAWALDAIPVMANKLADVRAHIERMIRVHQEHEKKAWDADRSDKAYEHAARRNELNGVLTLLDRVQDGAAK